MAKNIFTISALLFVLFINKSISQSAKPSLTAGVELKLPTGNSGKLQKAGVGGTIGIAFPVFKKYRPDISAGYFELPGKKIDGHRVDNVYAIPVKAGLRHLLTNNINVKPEVGYTEFYYEKSSLLSRLFFGAFTYAVGVGYIANKHFDCSFRYEEALFIGPDYAHFALRLGYTF